MLATCDNPHALMVVDDDARAAPSAPSVTSTPVPAQPRTPMPSSATTTYASCEAAQAAGAPRVSATKGDGEVFQNRRCPAPETATEMAYFVSGSASVSPDDSYTHGPSPDHSYNRQQRQPQKIQHHQFQCVVTCPAD